jgi:hypothetical protein
MEANINIKFCYDIVRSFVSPAKHRITLCSHSNIFFNLFPMDVWITFFC